MKEAGAVSGVGWVSRSRDDRGRGESPEGRGVGSRDGRSVVIFVDGRGGAGHVA